MKMAKPIATDAVANAPTPALNIELNQCAEGIKRLSKYWQPLTVKTQLSKQGEQQLQTHNESSTAAATKL